MEAVIIVAVVALANVACFLIGVKTGMAVAKGEPMELHIPMAFDYTKQVQRDREQREVEKEQRKYETILRNIESYDGTGIGQEDVV